MEDGRVEGRWDRKKRKGEFKKDVNKGERI